MKICRPFITVKGQRIHAKSVGKKAFCWEVTEEQHQAYLQKKAKEKNSNKEKQHPSTELTESDTENKE
ncbi:hypothetical protein ACOJQI_22805 (plasmid) [Bacillus salacetis]|uniref:hypothetical protein n=1 Tax=Bacillus salacetis TaxID=2315464 RepID=UPI003B9F1314